MTEPRHTPHQSLAPIGGRDPFTFHGHRLSSLYRKVRSPHNPFIFLKILKNCACGMGCDLSIYGKMKGWVGAA
jgi:hypothetical protein